MFLLSSCSNYNDLKKHLESLVCDIKITHKTQDNRYLYFKGRDSNQKYFEFEITQNWLIYDYVEIGDTLLKREGETFLTLFKKDTTLIFPLYIHGEEVEITTDDVKNAIVKKGYRFKITKKQKQNNKFIIFKGIENSGKKADFEEPEFWDVFNSVEIGDTLVKELGKTEIKIIKKDTVLIFHLYGDVKSFK
jgi:hypothetical protein